MSKQKLTQPEGWEIKDRNYYLTGNVSPLTFTIPSRHTRKHPLLWFDEGTGTQRELRYATNQNSCFVDEQKGESTLGHIIFEDGSLSVPKESQNPDEIVARWDELSDKTDHRSLESGGKQTEKFVMKAMAALQGG